MATEQIDDLIDVLQNEAKRVLSVGRYEHSKRVAETSAHLCKIHGLCEKKGFLAGISHDICKEIDENEMRRLALLDGRNESDLEKSKPCLLHGRAAATVLKQKFNVNDKDILDAVAFHTFGAVNLCDLGKIVFVADKIEPGRPQSTEEYRKNLYAMNLDEMTLCVLKENREYLEKKGKVAAPESIAWEKSLSR